MKKHNVAFIKTQLLQITDEEQLPQEWVNDERKSVQQLLNTWRKNQEKQKQSLAKLDALMQYEKRAVSNGYRLVAGIDEVGRGPLAGPVVAACVVMPLDDIILGINDSKQLSAKKRAVLYEQIIQKAISIGIGIVSPEEIDRVNIYQATKLAMQQAIDQMAIQPDYLLIDAMVLDNELPQEAIIKGDATSYVIAAASIVAKETRDRLMAEYATVYQGYGFEQHAGYGTKAHLQAIERYGITPIHRKSFEPIKSLVHKREQ